MIATEDVEVERDGLPEDVADAWATVLLDIYEKRRHAAGEVVFPNCDHGERVCPSTSRAKAS